MPDTGRRTVTSQCQSPTSHHARSPNRTAENAAKHGRKQKQERDWSCPCRADRYRYQSGITRARLKGEIGEAGFTIYSTLIDMRYMQYSHLKYNTSTFELDSIPKIP